MNNDIRNLNEKLLKLFLNLSDKFKEETSWQDGIYTGSIVVFEDVFMPYIVECVENNNDEECNNIFNFIEELVTSTNEYEKNVIEVAIIENMTSWDIREEFKKRLLPKSLISYNGCFPMVKYHKIVELIKNGFDVSFNYKDVFYTISHGELDGNLYYFLGDENYKENSKFSNVEEIESFKIDNELTIKEIIESLNEDEIYY